jgi:glutathione S-transferase
MTATALVTGACIIIFCVLPVLLHVRQVPFLTDDDGVEIFESGAILLYLADKYGKKSSTPAARAAYTKWVVWANSELDGLCFGKGMSGTMLDKPNKALDTLERLLSEKTWLVDNEFSVADVAVGSYLNYVPVFFGSVNPSKRPNLVKYMIRCAEREPFAKAFGSDHAEVITRKGASWLGSGGGSKPGLFNF